jgi:hypothetical protein
MPIGGCDTHPKTTARFGEGEAVKTALGDQFDRDINEG